MMLQTVTFTPRCANLTRTALKPFSAQRFHAQHPPTSNASPHHHNYNLPQSFNSWYSSSQSPPLRSTPIKPVTMNRFQQLRSLSTSHPSLQRPSIPRSSTAPASLPNFAFAFDIDGVLLRSSAPLPRATEALQYLHNNNIPFILLTNGGGKHESARVAELSSKLGVPLSIENFIQSHTPFKQLVESSETKEGLADKTVLVTGGDGDKCRQVAEMYGFKKVVTPGDILMAYPTIWPFNQIFSDYYHNNTRPLPKPVNLDNLPESLKIDAVFVFNDPRDWALDSQIILDLLLSKEGYLGTYSDKNGNSSLPNNGWQQDGQPKLYFSNPDLFWATSHHMPRLGQGGFQASLHGVWNATTNGATLDRTIIGKPHAATYIYAEDVLTKYRNQLSPASGVKAGRLDRVFMVGDNPESDILGANQFKSNRGTDWTSILVKTGVYRDGTEPAHKPVAIVKDVFDAVKWALGEEKWDGRID
ncbi:hypothetical protein HYFRA_00007129 [Hymenoscyphus fraxineus]|uniref:HAD-superfamily hydrolase n=1 Tax=Hymenoscyphus fraxineus TaxID=746836 RepID=A0A9N9PIY3_9HELO|nr:hypothetical protein HYFRA_00007129 [Hymenoscyphus fraxineus]